MRRSMIAQCVLRIFGSWNHDHSILFPSALGFRLDDFQIKWKCRRRQRLPEIRRSLSEKCLLLAEMIRNRDRSKTVRSIQIHELRNRKLSVAKGGVHMKIASKHMLLGYFDPYALRIIV